MVGAALRGGGGVLTQTHARARPRARTHTHRHRETQRDTESGIEVCSRAQSAIKSREARWKKGLIGDGETQKVKSSVTPWPSPSLPFTGIIKVRVPWPDCT
jgi:hypothetical protein